MQPNPVSERERRSLLLEQIVDSEEVKRISAILDESHYRHETDKVFLSYILSKASVRLEDLTDRSLDQEMNFWDRDHLFDLAANIGKYIGNPKAKEKFQYLVEHSIKGDLVAKLSSDDPTDKFAQYNTAVIKEIQSQGLKLDRWMSHGNNLRHGQVMEEGVPVSLEFIQWTRDFRREYSIGNKSDCCIAVNDKLEDAEFKEVLLDYFLDLSMQVIHINRATATPNDGKEVGQIYFTALRDSEFKRKDEDIKNPSLGVTSVEIAKEYRGQTTYVPAIIDAILGSEGYQEVYGFSSTIVGQRFALFSNYIHEAKNRIGHLIQRLKQRRQNYNQELSKVQQAMGNVSELISSKETLTREMDLLLVLKDQAYTPHLIETAKIGLQNADSEGTEYKGTNYLDMFAPPHRHEREAGFFNPMSRTFDIKAYHLRTGARLNAMETTLNHLNAKYATRKQQNGC